MHWKPAPPKVSRPEGTFSAALLSALPARWSLGTVASQQRARMRKKKWLMMVVEEGRIKKKKIRRCAELLHGRHKVAILSSNRRGPVLKRLLHWAGDA
jgi:hypothetical protein